MPNITGLKKSRTTLKSFTVNGPKEQHEDPPIECLKRPLQSEFASYASKKKRHNVYVKEQLLKTRLTKSNQLLRHYLRSVERKERDATNLSVLEDLG